LIVWAPQSSNENLTQAGHYIPVFSHSGEFRLHQSYTTKSTAFLIQFVTKIGVLSDRLTESLVAPREQNAWLQT